MFTYTPARMCTISSLSAWESKVGEDIMVLLTDSIAHTDLSPRIEPFSSMNLPFAFVDRGILEGCLSLFCSLLSESRTSPTPQSSSFGSGQSYLPRPLRMTGQHLYLLPSPRFFYRKLSFCTQFLGGALCLLGVMYLQCCSDIHLLDMQTWIKLPRRQRGFCCVAMAWVHCCDL